MLHRLVRWEDGTTQLFVGAEVLNASETDISSNHQHLYVRHKNFAQASALRSRMLLALATSQPMQHM